jgi:hypothetical protein
MVDEFGGLTRFSFPGIPHDVIRGQQIHDLVNHLPDRNYTVLKHLVRHFLK